MPHYLFHVFLYLVDFACQEGFCCGDAFPLKTWMKTSFNINAQYGGGTALLLMSRKCTEYRYEAVGSGLQLIRCGFDGNHFEATSVMRDGVFNTHHCHDIRTSPEGTLYPVNSLGNGHCSLISNIARMGNCSCAIVFEGGASPKFSTSLGLRPVCGPSGGCFIILCSCVLQSGENDAVANIYFVHQGDRNGDMKANPLIPNAADLWRFQTSEDGMSIEVKGPTGSHYAVHSVFSGDLLKQHKGGVTGKVKHTQAYDGSKATVLLKNCSQHIGRSILLMCSCSSGMYNESFGFYLFCLSLLILVIVFI